MASTQLQPLDRSPPQPHRPSGIVSQLLEVTAANQRSSGTLGVRRNVRAEVEQGTGARHFSTSPTRSPQQQRPKSYAPLSPLAPVNPPASFNAAAASSPAAAPAAAGISPTNAIALPAIAQPQVTNAAPAAAAAVASVPPVTADATLSPPALPFSKPRPVSASDPHLILRRAVAGDWAKGHMRLLSQLTACGEVSAEAYAARLEAMARAGDTYHLLVVEDTSLSGECIVGSATLVVELKLIHACAAVGHIEDVVVREGYRGKSIGVRIMQALHAIAKEKGCYKVMLDCNVENVHFYEKMDYKENSRHMRLDFH